MCICCNSRSHKGFEKAYEFLEAYDEARKAMKRAAKALEEFIPEVDDHKKAKQYKRVHHKMVRIRREWNKIECERESK